MKITLSPTAIMPTAATVGSSGYDLSPTSRGTGGFGSSGR